MVQWQRRSAADPDATVPVFGCDQHLIGLDLAAHVHEASCTAPDPAALPGCGCTPEPLPPQESLSAPVVTLSTGWTVLAVPEEGADA
jgi:hypothetical protein